MSKDIPSGFEPIALGIGYSDAFGPVYVDRAAGRLGFHVAERHLNPVSALHGGAMATFADMQIAAFEPGAGTAGSHTPTISMHVDYVAPARLGAWVEATVTLVKKTATLIFTQAVITADGAPCARSHAIYRNRRRNEPTGTDAG